ncbi:MAG TPA: four helix bundle protein [Gemmatimonadales bacterium]|nr:four helix bundle protein [Gemmatimonadales bacterium]
MADFKRLKIWRASHGLSVSVYALVRTLPREEAYGLRAQMTRAAGSIPANIAEGVGRGGDREVARFLDIALGSAMELECHVLRALDLRYIDVDPARAFLADLNMTQKMIASLRLKIRRRLRASGSGRRSTAHLAPRT